MRRSRHALVLATILAMVTALPASAGGLPAPGVPSDRDDPAAAVGGTGILVALRVAHHPGFDRIVFEFDGPVPAERSLGWVDQLWYDTAGPEMRAHVAGNAFLAVMFSPAWGCCQEPPWGSTYGPTARVYDLPNLVEILEIGDWEGYLSFGIGVMKKTHIVRATALYDPSRFVIDLATDFERTGVQGFFWDREQSRWTSVRRDVPTGNPPRGALVRLFAGPTLDERADGLRFVRSGATGFRDLRISAAGVARVTLKGGCASHGSERTIATEITRTLKAQPGIRWVKIYDPEGRTRRPTGHIDSIPDCLAA